MAQGMERARDQLRHRLSYYDRFNDIWLFRHHARQRWWWHSGMGGRNDALLRGRPHPLANDTALRRGDANGDDANDDDANDDGLQAWLFSTMASPHGSFEIPGEPHLAQLADIVEDAARAAGAKNAEAGTCDAVVTQAKLRARRVHRAFVAEVGAAAPPTARAAAARLLRLAERGLACDARSGRLARASARAARGAVRALARSSVEMRAAVLVIGPGL